MLLGFSGPWKDGPRAETFVPVSTGSNREMGKPAQTKLDWVMTQASAFAVSMRPAAPVCV